MTYAIVDAPGWCGDTATVWETASSAQEAVVSMRRLRHVVALEGCERPAGSKVPARLFGQLWPVRTREQLTNSKAPLNP